jgi:hypothetical protein
MNPFFFTAIKPYLEQPGYGLAVVGDDCSRIVAYWGRKAQPGDCTFIIRGDVGMTIPTYNSLLTAVRYHGVNPESVHWIANHHATNGVIRPGQVMRRDDTRMDIHPGAPNDLVTQFERMHVDDWTQVDAGVD